MAEFTTNIDIANRAAQACGVARIFSFEDVSDAAREIAFAYDKLRVAELQRNIWKFATRRAVLRPMTVSTLEFVPAAWTAAGVYVMGSIAAYGGMIYLCRGWRVSGQTTPDVSPFWVPYFGPMVANPYTAGGAYFAGELVFTPANEDYVVYVALANTSDVPGNYPPWSAANTYSRGQSVSFGLQLLFVPGSLPVFFVPGSLPVNPSGAVAQSMRDLNLGNNPQFDRTNWQVLPAAGQPDYRTGNNWLRLDASIRSIVTPYPLSTGPVSDGNTLNVYRLPNGYLRHAPTDPKSGLVYDLGGPTAAAPNDMVFEDNFIVTSESAPFMLRFIADMTDVTQMEPMFCEGFALRLAEDIGPVIIPKDGRAGALARIASRYRTVISDARLVDAIERGPTATPLDPYVACRV